MTAITITVDGAVSRTEYEPGLKFLQTAVGGYIEAVDIAEGMTMYVNEEGKMSGLAENVVATYLAWNAAAIAPHDWIAGDAIIAGFDFETGENRALTDEEVRTLFAHSSSLTFV